MAVLLEDLLFLEHPRTGSTAIRTALRSIGAKAYPRHQDPGHSDVIRVVTLREPYDLLVSWFLIVGERDGHKTLEDFILNSQQPNLVRGGRLFYFNADHYLRYPSLQKDLNLFLRVHSYPTVTLGRVNVTEGKQPFMSYYNNEAIDAVRQRFAEDLELYYATW